MIRALDLAVNEYQGGQDFVAAYEPATGQFRPGFPSPVNDLSFLSGPSVADLDGLPGEEVVGGTASLDLYGMNSAGAALRSARLAQADGRLDGRQSGGRLVWNTGHRQRAPARSSSR